MELASALWDLSNIIIAYLEDDDYNTLYQCSLINRAFNPAASKALYRRIIIDPPSGSNHLFRGTTYPEATHAEKPDWMVSSRLPKYAIYVKELRVDGPLLQHSTFGSSFRSSLASAIEAYPNLETIALTSPDIVRFVTANVFSAVLSRRCLHTLKLNGQINNPPARLTELASLKCLALSRPSRHILQLLPICLENLSPTLEELHLRNDCGSVTPGVLRSFASQLQNITAFTLGLTYSVTNDDLYEFLSGLINLTRLELHYYWQMRVPQSTPKLFKLISFSVKYPYFKTRQAADSLSVWIRRIVTNAPLEELRLEMLDVPRAGAVHTLNLDGLIYHLSSKHRYTLRILRMGWSFFGLIALADLCKCSNLEELEMLIKDNALKQSIPARLITLPKLRKLALNPSHPKRSIFHLSLTDVQTFFETGPESLQHLEIKTDWSATSVWTPSLRFDESGILGQHIEQSGPKRMPWERVESY